CRSAVDAVAEGPGGGYRSDPPARFYAADAAEPAEPGATRPADRSGHRSYQRRAKRGAVQAIGERCLGRAGNAEPADDILSRPGSQHGEERGSGAADDLRREDGGKQPSRYG